MERFRKKKRLVADVKPSAQFVNLFGILFLSAIPSVVGKVAFQDLVFKISDRDHGLGGTSSD